VRLGDGSPGLSVAVRSVFVGLGIELCDAAEGGTTGCFGVKLATADFSFSVVVFVVFVVVVVMRIIVALFSRDWKTFRELKVEV
jgi:hypothetical protein